MVLCQFTSVQADEYVIVDAKLALGHRTGSVLTPDSQIKLMPGSSITLMSSNGEMIEVKGPAKGKLADKLKGNASEAEEDPALVGAVAALFKSDGKSRKSLAAFRAVGQPNKGKLNYKTKNPWHVSLIKDGKYCIRDGKAKGVLWNPRRKIKTGDLAMGSKSVSLKWADGSDSVNWPADLPLDNGGSYSFQSPGEEKAISLTLFVVKSTDFNGMIKEMANNGCLDQGRNLLKAQARGELK